MAEAGEVRETALSYFRKRKLSCCESIIKAIKDCYQLPFDDNVLKLATGMAGGIGGQGCICEALLGAVMALGMIYGRNTPGGDRNKMMNIAAELYQYYEEKFEFFCCRTQLRSFSDRHCPEARTHCELLIGTMVDKACEIIEREGIPEAE